MIARMTAAMTVAKDGVSYGAHAAILSQARFRGSFMTFVGELLLRN